jgi:hypothetical protein
MKELRLIPILILIPLLLFISLTAYAYGGESYWEDSTESISEEECAYIAGTWDYHLTCTWGDCSWLTKPNGTIFHSPIQILSLYAFCKKRIPHILFYRWKVQELC